MTQKIFGRQGKVIKYYSNAQASPGLQILKVIKYYKSHAQAHAAGAALRGPRKIHKHRLKHKHRTQTQAQAHLAPGQLKSNKILLHSRSCWSLGW